MFTGPRPNEGKSLTVINVAISIAQEIEQTVLIVDADLRSPSVHKYFGLSGRNGLVDFFKEVCPFPNFSFILSKSANWLYCRGGNQPAMPAELIKSTQMEDLVHELKHCYQ